MDLAKLLGLDQTTVAKLLTLASELRDDLACLRTDLSAVTRQLSYGIGKARRDTDGYDPGALPGITRVQPAPGKTESISYRALLGRPALHGYIKNIGGVDVELVFSKPNAGGDGTTATNTLLLTPGEKIPIDGITWTVAVTTPSTAISDGDVQTYAR